MEGPVIESVHLKHQHLIWVTSGKGKLNKEYTATVIYFLN